MQNLYRLNGRYEKLNYDIWINLLYLFEELEWLKLPPVRGYSHLSLFLSYVRVIYELLGVNFELLISHF